MIRVVAVITTKPGRRDDLVAAFRANLPAVRAEKGCIEYAGHVDAGHDSGGPTPDGGADSGGADSGVDSGGSGADAARRQL